MLAAILATLPAQRAHAEPLARAAEPAPLPPAPPPARHRDPPVVAAVLIGLTTAAIPMVIGGTRAAIGPTIAQRNAGFMIAAGGLSLAPVMAHVALREWKRAAIFGALPLAATIGMSSLLLVNKYAALTGTTPSRTAFTGLFTLALFASGLGIVDATLADRRARGTGGGLIIGPSISRTQTTLEVGGQLPL